MPVMPLVRCYNQKCLSILPSCPPTQGTKSVLPSSRTNKLCSPLLFCQHLRSGHCHFAWLPRPDVRYIVTSYVSPYFSTSFPFLSSTCNILPCKFTHVVAKSSSYYGGSQGRNKDWMGPWKAYSWRHQQTFVCFLITLCKPKLARLWKNGPQLHWCYRTVEGTDLKGNKSVGHFLLDRH